MQENRPKGRRYDREFKENAVALVRAGRTISGVARDLGVTIWSLDRWVQDAKAGVRPRESATLAAETPEARELRRLRGQLQSVTNQRDILSLNRSTGFCRVRLFSSRICRVCTCSPCAVTPIAASAFCSTGGKFRQRLGGRQRFVGIDLVEGRSLSRPHARFSPLHWLAQRA